MASGLSGAGESMPAAAQEASRPGVCSSSNATRSLLLRQAESDCAADDAAAYDDCVV